MKSVIMAALIGVFMIQPVMAEQLVIKQDVWRGGNAYTIEVKDTASCINGARSISNTYQHSNETHIISGSFYKIEFFCMAEGGDITAQGKFYQIPHSIEGKMCLSKQFSWYINDNCDADNFKTLAVNIPSQHLYLYIRSQQK